MDLEFIQIEEYNRLKYYIWPIKLNALKFLFLNIDLFHCSRSILFQIKTNE